MIKFDVSGEPKGKGRPRVTTRKMGDTYRSIAYTPKETASYENWVKCCFMQAKQKRIDGNVPLIANITAYYGIPKSTSRKMADAMLSEEVLPTKKPDCDNIIKIILDSLNGIAYDDDKQIVQVMFRKLYTSGEPKVSVSIFQTSDKEAI
jgi:Holliday junction resolvase RusA-like endonuclease